MLRTFAFVACLLASEIHTLALAEQPTQKEKQANHAEKSDFTVGKPVHYKNLTIFPVESKRPKNEDRYLTLEEGLKANTVQVFEVNARLSAAGPTAAASSANQPANVDPFAAGDGPDVNRLMVLNSSGKPLYLMPGEIIYGGQQDRTIAQETIVPSSKKAVPLDVYCVEHGRWSARSNAETADAIAQLAVDSVQTQTWSQGQSAGLSSHYQAAQPETPVAAPSVPDAKTRAKMAEEAKHGKFVAHGGSLNKDARAAVQEGKGQQAVWDKVGAANAANSNQSESGDFSANYTDPQLAKNLQRYIDAMQSQVTNQKQVVGAIVAINGQVEAVDVFQSTPLFKKLWPKLLKSHALDAASAAKDRHADKSCSVKDAEVFLHDAMQGRVEKKSEGQGGLVVTKRDSANVMSFSAAPAAMGGMGDGMGGFDDSVHSSAYKK